MGFQESITRLVKLYQRRTSLYELTDQHNECNRRIMEVKDHMRKKWGTKDAGFDYIEHVAIKRAIRWV